MRRKRALRVIVENLELAFERISQVDKRRAPFEQLRSVYLDSKLE